MAEKDKFADEKLTDEQLDNVAGGLWDRHQLADDSRFLNVLLRGTDSQPERNNWAMVTLGKIADAWASVGIEIKEGSIFGGHSYNLDGKEITREEAYDIVRKNFKSIFAS